MIHILNSYLQYNITIFKAYTYDFFPYINRKISFKYNYSFFHFFFFFRFSLSFKYAAIPTGCPIWIGTKNTKKNVNFFVCENNFKLTNSTHFWPTNLEYNIFSALKTWYSNNALLLYQFI